MNPIRLQCRRAAGAMATLAVSVGLSSISSKAQDRPVPRGPLFPGSVLKSDVSTVAQRLVLEDFPGSLIDQVVVPVPGEIFSVMDKLGAPDWEGQLRSVAAELPSDRVELSLTFGATVAEGFLAVQAEDADAVKDLGRRLLKLGAALGIEDRVMPHFRSILQSAEVADWKAVRAEIDRTQRTVRESMQELRDGDLATLVSLSGWLRGTETLTTLIAENYSADRAELLNQPDLVLYFVKSLGEMKAAVRDREDVAAIAEGLVRIHRAMTLPSAPAAGTGEETGAGTATESEDQAADAAASSEKEAVPPKTVAPVASVSATAIDVEAVTKIRDICRQVLVGFYQAEEVKEG